MSYFPDHHGRFIVVPNGTIPPASLLNSNHKENMDDVGELEHTWRHFGGHRPGSSSLASSSTGDFPSSSSPLSTPSPFSSSSGGIPSPGTPGTPSTPSTPIPIPEDDVPLSASGSSAGVIPPHLLHHPRHHHQVHVPVSHHVPHSIPGVMAPMPFWSACPLPFNPNQYPMVILPQRGGGSNSNSAGPNSSSSRRMRSSSAKPIPSSSSSSTASTANAPGSHIVGRPGRTHSAKSRRHHTQATSSQAGRPFSVPSNAGAVASNRPIVSNGGRRGSAPGSGAQPARAGSMDAEARWKMKRSKKTWSHHPRRRGGGGGDSSSAAGAASGSADGSSPSQMHGARHRDDRGRYISRGAAIKRRDAAMARQVAELKAKLTEQTMRSQMLERELLQTKAIHHPHPHDRPPHVDDMFSRHVLNTTLGPHSGIRSSTTPVHFVASPGASSSSSSSSSSSFTTRMDGAAGGHQARHHQNGEGDPSSGGVGIYSPFRSGNAMVGAFTEEIDFRNKASELRPTPGTSYLDSERRYEMVRREELEMQGAKARYQIGPMAELPMSEMVQRRENKQRYLAGPMAELGGSEVLMRRENKDRYLAGPMVELTEMGMMDDEHGSSTATPPCDAVPPPLAAPGPVPVVASAPPGEGVNMSVVNALTVDDLDVDDVDVDMEFNDSFETVWAALQGSSPPDYCAAHGPFGTSPPGDAFASSPLAVDDSEMMDTLM